MNKTYLKERKKYYEELNKTHKHFKKQLFQQNRQDIVFLEDSIEILKMEIVYHLFDEVDTYVEMCFNAMDMDQMKEIETEKAKQLVDKNVHLKKFMKSDE